MNRRPQTQTGFALGTTAAKLGLLCPQPSMSPSRKSSTAASYAAPQFGSLFQVDVRPTTG
jgi:hypothetical protein